MEAVSKHDNSLLNTLASAVAQSKAQTEECQQLRTSLHRCEEEIRKLQEEAKNVEKLRKENESLQRRLQNNIRDSQIEKQERISGTYEQLLEDNHMKQARIDALENQLQGAQARARKWRQRHPLSSLPARSDGPALSELIPASLPTLYVAFNNTHIPLVEFDKTPPVSDLIPPSGQPVARYQHSSDTETDGRAFKRKRLVNSGELPSTLQVPASPENGRGVESSFNRHSLEKKMQGTENWRGHEALRELSGNERQTVEVKSEPIARNSSRKRKSDDGRGAKAIPFLAEDGEDRNAKNGVIADPAHKNTTPFTVSAHRRLGNLLSKSRPSKSILHQTEHQHCPKNAESSPLELGGPRKFLPLTRSHSATGSLEKPWKPPVFLLPKTRRPRAEPEDQEHFRSRPLDSLRLCHFRINPRHNDGLHYAYTDVVRNQHQRKCLPGCARPACCGEKFKALAETLPGLQNWNGEPWDEHSISLHVSEYDLLLNFMGPKSEERIRTLTPLARENLLHEARIRMVADLYGKHRHAHERAESPPGFWRTEFPGTQEEQKDRERAHAKEREEVRRRYEDALKGGGKWMFADEYESGGN